MSYRSRYAGTVTIWLDDQFYVKLRHLKAGEVIDLSQAAQDQSNNVRMALDALLASIVEWNLTDEQEQIMPISEENVRELAPEHLNLLMEEVSKMTGSRREPSFRGDTGASDHDGRGTSTDPVAISTGTSALAEHRHPAGP